jgi:Caspase domain
MAVHWRLRDVTEPIDSALTQALVVGIERYEAGPKWNLDGAASGALRIANWLRNLGVPAENIVALLSPLETSEDIIQAELERLGLKNQRRPATFDALKRAVLEELPDKVGDFLVFYWCGHGVDDQDLQQRLFTSNAGARVKDNINVTHLLSSLSAKAFGNRLRRQLVIVDACANFVQEMNSKVPLPDTTFRLGDHRQVERDVFLASSQGEKALHDQAARSGKFTQVVAGWLEAHANVLPPDADELMAAVSKQFEQLRAGDVTRQRPTRIQVTTRAVGTRQILLGGVPVPDEEWLASLCSGLTPAQLRRTAESIAKAPQLSSRESRDQFVTALSGVVGAVVRADDRVADVANVLAAAIQRDAFQSVFDQLLVMAGTDEERQAAAFVRHRWEVQVRVVPLLDALNKLPIDTVHRALAWTSCEASASIPEVDLALETLADLSAPAGGIPPLAEFVLRLERLLPPGTLKLVPGWLERHGVNDAVRDTLRPRFEAEEDAVPKLVIDLQNSASGVWQSTVTGYLSPRWCPRTVVCEPTRGGVQGAVNQIVRWATTYAASLAIGFLIPYKLLCEVPEQWMYESPAIEPIALCEEFPVVLHLDRTAIQDLTQVWRQKLKGIDAAGSGKLPVLWLDRDDAKAIRHAVRQAKAGYVALNFVPSTHDDMRADAVMAAIAGGAPYVVWANSTPQPEYDLAERIEQIIHEAANTPFPDALWSSRIADPFLSEALRVIWDRPDQVPIYLARLGQELMRHG